MGEVTRIVIGDLQLQLLSRSTGRIASRENLGQVANL